MPLARLRGPPVRRAGCPFATGHPTGLPVAPGSRLRPASYVKPITKGGGEPASPKEALRRLSDTVRGHRPGSDSADADDRDEACVERFYSISRRRQSVASGTEL
jgi:hypothetical protein